jgi:hypothetical protein
MSIDCDLLGQLSTMLMEVNLWGTMIRLGGWYWMMGDEMEKNDGVIEVVWTWVSKVVWCGLATSIAMYRNSVDGSVDGSVDALWCGLVTSIVMYRISVDDSVDCSLDV